MNQKKQILHNKLHFYLFALLAFILPIHNLIIPSCIVLILLNWIIEGRFIQKFKLLKNNRSRQYLLLFSLLYILYVLGLVYSKNLKGQEGGYFDIEVKLSLFIFPIIISTLDKNIFSEKKMFVILGSFISGCILTSIMCLGGSFINYIDSGSTDVFYYSNISGFLHPGYFSMYLNFAIAIIVSFLFKRRNTLNFKWKAASISAIIYFTIFIVLLSSKAGMLCIAISYAVVIVHLIVIQKKIVSGIIYFFVISAVLIIMINVFSGAKNRLIIASKVISQRNAIEANTVEATASRVLIWRSSIEIIKENLFFGVGTGDVKYALLDKYKEKGISNALELRLNAHNQYLQTFISIGLLGFLVLILSLLLPVIDSIKKRNLLYFLFLIIITFNILVESMFETQAGVVFYAFINSFLFFMRSDQLKYSTFQIK